MPMFDTHGLTRRFGAKLAVDGLTISIESAESFAFLGPNGAGKTTTIKMRTTLLPPSSGSATVAGCDIVGVPPMSCRERQRDDPLACAKRSQAAAWPAVSG